MTNDFADVLGCHCLAARKRAQWLTRLYDGRMRDTGLTVHQFTLLTTLILAGPLTVAALAEQLGIDRTTLSRNLRIGMAHDLVSMEPGADARERLVSATRNGRRLAKAALPAWRAAQDAASAQINTA